MSLSLQEVCRARLPAASLAVLAGLRGKRDVLVTLDGNSAWVDWPKGDDSVLMRVLAAEGVELFVRQEGTWHRLGESLPFWEMPQEHSAPISVERKERSEPLPLHRLLVPAPFQPTAAEKIPLRPVTLRLVRSKEPRQASALHCSLSDLAIWADVVPTTHLASLSAARQGDRVLLMGRKLPTFPRQERFWGKDVLLPLGWRPEPNIPASALRDALHVTSEEILLLREDGAECFPRSAFQPLTRAGVRLARKERE